MLLAGDIGGTSARLGLFAPTGPRPDLIVARVYATASFAGFDDMVARFLADTGQLATPISAACVGAAGPVVDETVSLTNIAWRIDARSLALRFRVGGIRLLNDLEALAWAIPVLRSQELATLQAGAPAPGGHAAVIAAGTGLNEAVLRRVGDRYAVFSAEAGHADLAVRTPREIDLLKAVIAWNGRADYERVLSGPGLVTIHRFTHLDRPCADPGGADASPSRVTEAAMAGRCPRCAESLDLFVGLLGAEAGNLALRAMATAGVYLGGGIPPKILPALRGGGFLQAFRAKHPMHDLMSDFPVHVILNEEAGLLGAAVAAIGADSTRR